MSISGLFLDIFRSFFGPQLPAVASTFHFFTFQSLADNLNYEKECFRDFPCLSRPLKALEKRSKEQHIKCSLEL